jgi:hypothetical protein
MVFTIDDGLFGLHLDWVEAVYPRSAAPVHVLKAAGEHSRAFILHQDEPALIVDLREAVGLERPLGKATRNELLVLHSGSLLLALPSDGCVGVRDLDLRTQTPLPTRLLRDGDVPVGHVVELDAKMLIVLDPSRLVDGAVREALVSAQRKALSFQQREAKRAALWTRICRQPTAADVRAYARLCSRNGNGKTAAAARVLERYLSDKRDVDAGAGDPPLLPVLMRHARARYTGELIVEVGGDSEPGQLFLVAGQVIDARDRHEYGRTAFKHLLAHGTSARQGEMEMSAHAEVIPDSTVALVISTLAALDAERRGRRGR